MEGGQAAYKMDDTAAGNMRAAVALGTCDCCDYFLLHGEVVTLIEETRLMCSVEEIRAEYDLADKSERESGKVVRRVLRDELRRKVYGAMLVLCRLAMKEGELHGVKKHRFWLVASNIKTAAERRYFHHIKSSLRNDLRGVVGAQLLIEVEMFTAEALPQKLANLSS